jgi:hypothetical protein
MTQLRHIIAVSRESTVASGDPVERALGSPKMNRALRCAQAAAPIIRTRARKESVTIPDPMMPDACSLPGKRPVQAIGAIFTKGAMHGRHHPLRATVPSDNPGVGDVGELRRSCLPAATSAPASLVMAQQASLSLAGLSAGLPGAAQATGLTALSTLARQVGASDFAASGFSDLRQVEPA